VSLIPRTIFDRIEVGELKPTRMTLQLPDSSVRLPLGIVEDVPVLVGKFYVPTDFVVMEMEEDKEVPIILGRPFLRTAGAMIDVKNDTLTINIGDDKVRFQIDRTMKYPSSAESCFKIDVIDECLEGLAEDYLLEQTNRSLRYHLNFLSEIQVEESEAESICAANATTVALDKLPHGPHNSHKGCVNLDFGEGLGPDKANPATPHKSSVTHTDRAASQTEPTPELKPLPANLRYEYLGPNNSCPVIVKAGLSPEQTAKLLEKLKIHKGVIGYSIKDLKGINPTICSHRILLEDCHKPSVEHQRRLNPNLKEEFDLEIKDKKGIENTVADHLSQIRLEDESDTLPINDSFPDEQLLAITYALYEADTASTDSHSVRVVHDTGLVTYHSNRVNSLAEP
jgi:hypothetical protein